MTSHGPRTPGGPVQPFPTKPANSREEVTPYHPDRVRAYLGYAIVGILIFVILVLTVRMFQGELDTREYAEIVFPAILGLSGTAVGFYFSEQARRD